MPPRYCEYQDGDAEDHIPTPSISERSLCACSIAQQRALLQGGIYYGKKRISHHVVYTA